MIPCMKLNTTPVTSSHPPQIAANARIRETGEAGAATADAEAAAAETAEAAAGAGSRAGTDRRDAHSSAPSEISAAGSSQLTCPPNSDPNSRKIPVDPPNPPPPGPGPAKPAAPSVLLLLNPMDPVSVPSSRPRPLYPKASCKMLLFVDPPKYGRSAAGVS